MKYLYRRWKLNNIFQNIGLKEIYIPFFQKMEVTPSGGYSLSIKLHVGMSPTRIQKKLEHLAVAMKVAQVELRRVRKNKYKLSFRHENIHYFPQVPSLLGTSINSQQISSIPLGLDGDGFEVSLPIFYPQGAYNCLIGGNPGQGKTSALRLILNGLVNTNTCIIWFDPKNGSDALQYNQRVNVVSDPLNPLTYLDTLEKISLLIHGRNKLVASGQDISILPKVIIFIDEWSTLGSIGSKQEQIAIQTEIRKIVSIGRSSFVSVILGTQRPTSATNVDVATRELCSHRIAFQVGDDHASEAILGQRGAENKENPLKPGQALCWIDGKLVRTNLYMVPPNLKELTNIHSGLKSTLDDLIKAENT